MLKACGVSLFIGAAFAFQNCSPGFQLQGVELTELNSQGTTLLIQEQQKALVILSQNCKACHQEQSLGGISKILDVEHLKSSGLIKVGSPAESAILIAIEEKRMPPGQVVSGADQITLRNWILMLGNQAAVNTNIDMTFNLTVSIDPLPFKTRFQKVGYVMGSTASPTLNKLNETRTFLGDYDFAKAIMPKFSWEPNDMKAWLEGLEPVCGSIAFRTRYPYPDGINSFYQNTLGRMPNAVDLTVLTEITNLNVAATEKSDLLCFTVMTSMEFISK